MTPRPIKAHYPGCPLDDLCTCGEEEEHDETFAHTETAFAMRECSGEALACDGCQWKHEGNQRDWCHMFQTAPDQLPCAQHDKFKFERIAMSAMIRKCPSIIPLMVMGLSEPNK